MDAQLLRNEESGGSYTELVRDFLEPSEYFDVLAKNRFNFFCGVPDSILKDFCSYVTDHVPSSRHIRTANEGAAVAVAAGYHLATRETAVVYLQVSN